MLRRGIITIAALSLLFAGSAFAGEKDNAKNLCKDKDVVGSYTRVEPLTIDDGFEGVYDKTFIRQLNLNAGGTAHQMRTTSPELMMNSGMSSVELGSWACRDDGTLLVTVIGANYLPIPADGLGAGSVPDIWLVKTLKITYLFSVEDADTLKLIQAISRRYNTYEDPTDPAAGYLGPESFAEFFYDRLIPSDADLTP